MKTKIIIKILWICIFLLNLFGISTILQYYKYISNKSVISLVIFICSFALSILIFLCIFLKLNRKIPFFLIFIVIGIHIFMQFYNLLKYPNFWRDPSIIIVEIKLYSILTIIIGINIVLLFLFTRTLPDKENSYSIKIKEILGKLNLWLSSIFIYVPILAGILTPMFIYFPIAYLSWKIFSFVCRTRISYYDYYNSWFVINPDDTSLILTLIVIETIIFIFGLFIFLWGLIHLAKARRSNINIVQTGPYKFIRHPQNLGILIMSFPFVLYIPEFILNFLNLPFYHDLGIRVADFLSWILFSLIIIVICDFEERIMIKKFPLEYNNYKDKAGFLFPRIRKQKLIQIKDKKIYYVLRYSLLIFCFILIVLITNFIGKILYMDRIVDMYR